MSFVNTAIIGSAVIGAGASIAASNTSAKAIDKAASAARADTAAGLEAGKDAQAIAAAEMAPYANRGAQANDAIARMLGLGAETTRAAARPGGASYAAASGVSEAQAYFNRYPDVAAEAQRQATNPKSQFYGNAEAYAQFHFDTYGRGEGRDWGYDPEPAQDVEATTQQAPNQPAQPGYSGVATNTNPAAAGFESSPFGTMEQDAAATFESSPWWSIANDEIEKSIGDLDSRYGASGLLLSGGATRARAEIAAGMRGDLFGKHLDTRESNFADYFGGLQNLQGTGFQAASGVASGGANFATLAANAATNNAANRINAAGASADARQQGVSDATGFAGWSLSQLANRAPKVKTPTPITPVTQVQPFDFGGL